MKAPYIDDGEWEARVAPASCCCLTWCASTRMATSPRTRPTVNAAGFAIHGSRHATAQLLSVAKESVNVTVKDSKVQQKRAPQVTELIGGTSAEPTRFTASELPRIIEHSSEPELKSLTTSSHPL